MSSISSYLLIILCAFFLGSVPFFYLLSSIVSTSKLQLISTRRYLVSKTYELPLNSLFLTVIFIVFDLLKGILAVYVGDLILGPSDFSLVISVFSCLLGNIMSQHFLRKDYVSSLFILGLFLYLTPMVAVFIFLIGLIVWLVFKNIFIFEIVISFSFVAYYLVTDNPVSYLAYAVFVSMYCMFLESDSLKKLFDKFV